MSRIPVAVVAMLSAVAIGTGVAAAEKKDHRAHHYFWVETPSAPRDTACDMRLLSALINRGDICPADDAPLAPPIVAN
jgi:hypothetical protein